MSEADARKNQTKTLFNAVAPSYDEGPGCFAHFGRRLVKLVGVEPGQRVLDVASGRGAVLFPSAECAGAHGEVIGVDLSDEMAKATNQDAERMGVAARVRVADAEELDFPGESFDRVLCGFGVMFFPDQDRALGQMRRVLKPGGRLGVSTWRVAQADELSAVLAQLGFGGGQAPGWITEPDALVQLLKRNDFKDVRVEVDSQVFRYVDRDAYWRQALGTGLRGVLGKLDAAATQRVQDAFAERVKPYQKPDGLYIGATALLGVAGR